MDRRSVVKPLMVAKAEELARLVIPGGKRVGHEWIGMAPDGREWSVNIGHGPRRGVASVWSEALHVDIVGFLVAANFGDDFEAAMQWAYRRHRIDGGTPSPADLQRQREQAARIAQESQARAAADDAARLAAAVKIWRLPGNRRGALAYLASRGLGGAPVRYVKFSSSVPYDEGSIEMPAVLWPVVDLKTAEFIGVHRTFVETSIDGGLRKVRTGSAKKSRGPVGGGLILLVESAGVPWRAWLTDPNRATEPLVLAEGVENSLSVATAFPGVRACAFISATYLGAVARQLPRQADPIIFVCDRDGASRGRDAIRKHREEAFALWLSQGRTVLIYAPPRGVKDANDHLTTLIRDHGYQAQFARVPPVLDYRTVLAEAQTVVAGDPVALWWEKVTGARWGDGGEPALRLHAALATVERSDVMLPAAVMPVIGARGEPIGAVVAWLASRGEAAWDLAPLMVPVRIVGDVRGVVVLRKMRRERDPAVLVLGLESGLVTARLAKRTVLCAIDASHAAYCAPGVPEDIDACHLWTDNADVTLGGQVFTQVARERLNQAGLGGDRARPWDEFTDFAAMLRDRDLERTLAG